MAAAAVKHQKLRPVYVCVGCMAALQAEHFLQVHGAAEAAPAKVHAEGGVAKPLENGAAHQNGVFVNESGPQLVAAL